VDTQLITDLLAAICAASGHPQPVRNPMRVWSLSGVERLTFPDGSTAISSPRAISPLTIVPAKPRKSELARLTHCTGMRNGLSSRSSSTSIPPPLVVPRPAFEWSIVPTARPDTELVGPLVELPLDAKATSARVGPLAGDPEC